MIKKGSKKLVHLKIEENLVEKVVKIVKAKNPLRRIKTRSKAIQEALIAFVLENQEFLEFQKLEEAKSCDGNTI